MKSPRPPSRLARWSILTLLLAIGLGAVLAKHFANAALKTPPAGYIVALQPETRVKLRWKTRRVATTLTLAPNAVVNIPDGQKVLLIHADAREETISGPARIQIPTSDANAVDFLVTPLGDLLTSATGAPPAPEVSGTLHVTSPVAVTRFRNPILSWTTQEGVNYDVAVVDPADEAAPPRIRRGIRPPIPLATLESPQAPELAADRIFLMLVRKAGDAGILGTSRFLTSPDATVASLPDSPQELLTEAVTALSQKPTRTGDAWLALSRLPEAWKQCELAIRLRLKVATDLGLTDEIAVLKAELRKL